MLPSVKGADFKGGVAWFGGVIHRSIGVVRNSWDETKLAANDREVEQRKTCVVEDEVTDVEAVWLDTVPGEVVAFANCRQHASRPS